MKTYLALFSILFLTLSGFAMQTSTLSDTNSQAPVETADSLKVDPDSSKEKAADLEKDTADKVPATESSIQKEKDSAQSQPTKIVVQNTIEKTKEELSEIPIIQNIISPAKIIWSIILLIITYFIIKLLVLIVDRLAERSTSYRITLKSFAPFIRILGWSLTIFIIIQGVFRPPVETLVALLASVGIAIGFASQDILKNIFGGIMILFDQPFQVGDKIQIGDHYGEVKTIGLRSTRIQTQDDSLVSVPNAEVVNKAVSNANSGEPNCQVVAEIYLPIDVDTNAARQIAIEAAQVSRYIYLNKPIAVLFINEVKERRSYLKMRLKAYVSDIRYEFTFQSDMTEIVIKEFINQGVVNKEDLS